MALCHDRLDTERGICMDIHSACSLGYDSFVEQIVVETNVNINAKNRHGWTPLMYACWGGHERVVGLLLRAGASVTEFNNNNQSALLLATKCGNLQIVQLTFLKRIVDEPDKSGTTALFNAVEYRYYEIARYLLKKGANVNLSCGYGTPLMIAAANGELLMVDLLLSYGADKDLQNSEGLTAQQLAANHGHFDVVELLNTFQQEFPTLKNFLESLSLEKYLPLFENQDIDLQELLNLNENDLKSIGIKLLGPRRKISLAITALSQRNSLL